MENEGDGKVYIYHKTSSGWPLEATLSTPEVKPNHPLSFGYKIDLNGNQLVVTADPYTDIDPGRVYVFRNTGSQWRQIAKLSDPERIPATARRYFNFGLDIANNGSDVFAVAQGYSTPPRKRCYVYQSTDMEAEVAAIQLYNAKTNQLVPGYKVIHDGDVIDLDQVDLPTADAMNNLNIVASILPVEVGSVEFNLSGTKHVQVTDNNFFYSLFGDTGEDILGGALIPGKYTLSITPYPKANKEGNAGKPTTISFTVVNNQIPYQPKPFPQTQKIFASDASANQTFGDNISVSGNFAAIHGGSTIYMFEKINNTWKEQQKLKPSNPQYPTFTNILSLSGEWLFACALSKNSIYESVVYVFRKNGSSWQETQVLSNNVETNQGGNPIMVRGNTALVKNKGNKIIPEVDVYQYDGNSWKMTTKLKMPKSNFDFVDYYETTFGQRLTFNDNYAIVSDLTDAESGTSSGAAFVYRKQGDRWVFTEKIRNPDAQLFAGFGNTIAIHDNQLVISSWAKNVYVYELKYNRWRLNDILHTPDKKPDESFGYIADITTNQVVANSQFGVVFEKIGKQWTNIGSLIPNPDDYEFSDKVVFAQNEILVGVPYDNQQGEHAGVVYVYSREESDPLVIYKVLLVDAAANKTLTTITNNKVINLARFSNSDFNIKVATPLVVGSLYAELILSGANNINKLIAKRTENEKPYFVFGDINGQPKTWQPEEGTYILKLTPYADDNRKGDQGETQEITFQIKEKNANLENELSKVDLPVTLADQISTLTPPHHILVYPNPAHDQVKIKLDEAIQDYILTIYDSLGKLIYKKSGSVNLEETLFLKQKPGICTLVLENGGHRYVERVVIE